jgi:uncharacterized membrane protein
MATPEPMQPNTDPPMSATDPVRCEACHHLDGTDGTHDGSFGAVAGVVRTEHNMYDAIRRLENRSADRITTYAGSMKFIYIHAAWFGVWVSLNVGLAGIGWEFDRFPFGLLTMIVSLEAIFLATFVMISQNRQSARSDFRNEIDFENNLRAEMWSVHIGHQLGIDPTHVEAMVQQALSDAKKRMVGAA